MTTTTVREGIKAFFHDFKIDEKDGLTYSFIENIYSKSDDSFDRVFHSKQGNGSYKATWNRFLKHYPEETIGKFFKLI
ncbi:hypothetical protein IKN40_09405 [bacterium]|nr:hypothetical protein [bacterium]